MIELRQKPEKRDSNLILKMEESEHQRIKSKLDKNVLTSKKSEVNDSDEEIDEKHSRRGVKRGRVSSAGSKTHSK